MVDQSSIRLKVYTAFGLVTEGVNVALHFERACPDIMKEPVANIVQKSLLRCVTISAMSTGETAEEGSLKDKVLSLMTFLGMKPAELERLCGEGSTWDENMYQEKKNPLW